LNSSGCCGPKDWSYRKTTESSEESTLETKETELWKTWSSALCSHWLTIRNR
jgi:hypothetical protein